MRSHTHTYSTVVALSSIHCSEAFEHMYTLIAGAASLLSNYEMIMLMMLHVDLLQEKIC